MIFKLDVNQGIYICRKEEEEEEEEEEEVEIYTNRTGFSMYETTPRLTE